MTHVNDEDVDLGLALGSANYSVETRLDGSSGAGGNATSRVDMSFAASDPLSGLVWSPHNGLSLQCADSSMPHNKPFLVLDVGPGVKDLSTSESTRSKGSGDNKVVDDELDAIQGRCDGGSKCEMEEDAGTSDANKEENGEDNGEEDLSSSHNVQIADTAESSKKHSEQDNLAEGTDDGKVDMAMNWRFSSKLIRRTRCNQSRRFEINASSSNSMGLAIPLRSEPLVCSLPNLQSREESDNEVTSASGNVNKNRTRTPVSIAGRHLLKLESSAENDLSRLAEAHILGETRPLRENSLPVDRSPMNSRMHLYQDKGKDEALSDGSISGRSSNCADDSHESVESCNSAGLFWESTRRHSYDQEQLVGSKRMKKQVQGCHDSTSIVRPDSSFMNWISNMVKGLSDSSKEGSSRLGQPNDVSGNINQDSTVCKKTHDCESPGMGFETMFQSLYCRKTKMSDSGVQKDNSSIQESKELKVAGKKSIENLPLSCDGNNDNSCEQIILSKKEVNPHISRNSNPLAMNCIPEKSHPPASLWITRLYTRTAMLDCSIASPKANLSSRTTNVFSIDQKTSEARDDSADHQVHASEQEMKRILAESDASVDLKSINKLSRTQLPQKLRSSEAMASVFEKQLDAIKHIIHPSEKRKSSTSTLTCFFCGQTGHDLRKCPELTEIELKDLLVNICSFDGVQESPCLCIRCFQFDHWTISCPLLPSNRNRQSERNAGFISQYSACRLQLCADNEKCSSYPGREDDDHNQVAAHLVACSSKEPCLDSSNEYQTSTALNSENDLRDKHNFPPCNFVNARGAVLPEEMFHAIRKLRMSRADILRWMNSDVSFSHLNGLFLRFRLAKLEAGLGETGYYVACITGDTAENIRCESKKSILVDVGGIKSSVRSHYISNHDFLEDEIKAWWIKTVKNGGKIPSLHELNSKFVDRKRLGF